MDFYDWVDYLRSLYVLDSVCVSQDYNEVTEIGFMFILLPITAVITVSIMLMCQTKTQEQKFWNLQDSDNGIQEDVKAIFPSNGLYWKWLIIGRQEELKWRNESACPGDRLVEEISTCWKTAPSS